MLGRPAGVAGHAAYGAEVGSTAHGGRGGGLADGFFRAQPAEGGRVLELPDLEASEGASIGSSVGSCGGSPLAVASAKLQKADHID